MTYQWDPSVYLSNPTVADPIFFARTLGELHYSLTVTDPQTDCSARDRLIISIVDGAPSGFVGNTLAAAKVVHSVSLTWRELDVRNYNLHRTADKKELDRSIYRAPVLIDITGSEAFMDLGAIPAQETLLFYQVYGRDCDDESVLP